MSGHIVVPIRYRQVLRVCQGGNSADGSVGVQGEAVQIQLAPSEERVSGRRRPTSENSTWAVADLMCRMPRRLQKGRLLCRFSALMFNRSNGYTTNHDVRYPTSYTSGVRRRIIKNPGCWFGIGSRAVRIRHVELPSLTKNNPTPIRTNPGCLSRLPISKLARLHVEAPSQNSALLCVHLSL